MSDQQQHIHPAALFGKSPVPPGGSSATAGELGREIRNLFVRQSHRSPRSVQRAPGPSELGVECDRAAVSKLAGIPETWHGVDPWPSIVGLALDEYLKTYFRNENALSGYQRWICDGRVAAHPRYPGTSDVYDTVTYTVIDMKAQGDSTRAKLMGPDAPGQRYYIQLLHYAQGWRNAGWRVDRIAIVSLPRTKSSLAEMYVWDKFLTPEDDAALARNLIQIEARRHAAQLVMNRQLPLDQVKRTSGFMCGLCSWYRPESARDGDFTRGCPGHSVSDDAQPFTRQAPAA